MTNAADRSSVHPFVYLTYACVGSRTHCQLGPVTTRSGRYGRDIEKFTSLLSP